jgi:uncharacterized protein YraI
MSKASNVLVAAAVVFSASQARAETVTAEKNLNLRSGPGPAFAVVFVMPRGSRIAIERCHGDWCNVSSGGRRGYVSRALLNIGANAYASAAPPTAPPPAAETSPPPDGSVVWHWRDREWRDRNWRRLEWHNRLKH